MDLRERLRLLKAAGAGRPEQSPPIPALAFETEARPAGSVPLPTLLGGSLDGYIVGSDAGETFYIETRYPVEQCRGPLPLKHLLQVPGESWERLGCVPRTLDPRHAVFLDTETTGLAGGTGTYAFLVGLGFFDRFDFVVRQYFLRDYAEEGALLEGIAADLAPFEALITFNGKAFDWPLLETRYRMARRRPPLPGAPHLDLLHPARRVWKERLQQCNLTNLEAQVLGVHRQGDVPGHLIPQLYFDYLRSGRLGPLADVVLHNRQDIVSLVSLAGWLGHIVSDPMGPTPDGELVCGDDLYSVGRLFEDRGLLAQGLACYEAACERGTPAVGETRALRELSRAYKRAREHGRAHAIWQAMIAGAGATSLYPYVELAKHYEHVTREYELARTMAARALELAHRRRTMVGTYGPGTLRDLQELQRRVERLDRKLSAR